MTRMGRFKYIIFRLGWVPLQSLPAHFTSLTTLCCVSYHKGFMKTWVDIPAWWSKFSPHHQLSLGYRADLKTYPMAMQPTLSMSREDVKALKVDSGQSLAPGSLEHVLRVGWGTLPWPCGFLTQRRGNQKRPIYFSSAIWIPTINTYLFCHKML